MNPVAEAVLASLRASIRDLGEVVSGLGPESLNWRPAAETNSIASQIAHAASSGAFWVRAGGSQQADRREYLEQRDGAFSFGADGAALHDLLGRFEGHVTSALAAIDGGELAAMRSWPAVSDDAPVTVAWCLVHAADHVREHAGAAMLTRQLWLQRQEG